MVHTITKFAPLPCICCRAARSPALRPGLRTPSMPYADCGPLDPTKPTAGPSHATPCWPLRSADHRPPLTPGLAASSPRCFLLRSMGFQCGTVLGVNNTSDRRDARFIPHHYSSRKLSVGSAFPDVKRLLFKVVPPGGGHRHKTMTSPQGGGGWVYLSNMIYISPQISGQI